MARARRATGLGREAPADAETPDEAADEVAAEEVAAEEVTAEEVAAEEVAAEEVAAEEVAAEEVATDDDGEESEAADYSAYDDDDDDYSAYDGGDGDGDDDRVSDGPAAPAVSGADTPAGALVTETLAITTDVLLVAGGAIAVTGIILWALAGGDDTEGDPEITAGCGPTGCSAGVRGVF